MDKIYLSEAGLERLKTRLKDAQATLKETRREKSVAYTATGDTWHDNPYFNKLEQDEQRQAAEVSELERQITSADVYSTENRGVDQVQIGSIVRIFQFIEATDDEQELVWEICGFGETNTGTKSLAYNSPIGRVLIGQETGDEVEVVTPKGKASIEICELYPDWEDVPSKFK